MLRVTDTGRWLQLNSFVFTYSHWQQQLPSESRNLQNKSFYFCCNALFWPIEIFYSEKVWLSSNVSVMLDKPLTQQTCNVWYDNKHQFSKTFKLICVATVPHTRAVTKRIPVAFFVKQILDLAFDYILACHLMAYKILAWGQTYSLTAALDEVSPVSLQFILMVNVPAFHYSLSVCCQDVLFRIKNSYLVETLGNHQHHWKLQRSVHNIMPIHQVDVELFQFIL